MKERYINFILFVIVLIVIILFGYTYLSYKNQDVSIEVENIVVNKSQVTLEPNKSETITATILPSNATNKTLTWTSSNTNVVKVSSSGIITAIKDGNATITVKASNGKQAQISVIVKSKYIAVENININKTSLNLTKGNSETLIATITPSNATNKTLIWTSSNTSIAKVDTNGNISAVGVGSAVITVKSSNGKIAICNITIKDNTFQNPISRGGDPYVTQKDGYYYYTKTTGNNTIVIYKSKDLTKLESNPKTVFTSSNRKAIWAPEIHYVNGYWYIYYSDATSSDNASRRMYVLRSKTQDAQGEYEYLGQITGMPNAHAIDGTILQWNGEYYFLWSAYKDSTSKEQRIYIAHMSNPYTVDSSRVEIAKANYDWEKHGNFINEGPQVLIKDGTLHVIYSASGANTIYYCLGMLTYTGGDLLKTSSWKKSSKPVFESANGVYGPGHASFVKSPDGKEDWIVYHAVVSESDAKIWNRTIRIQKFTWNGTTPVFGKPLSIDKSITLPSGTK